MRSPSLAPARTALIGAAGLLWLLLAGSACAVSSNKPTKAGTADDRDVSALTIEEANAVFDRAEQQLSVNLGREAKPGLKHGPDETAPDQPGPAEQEAGTDAAEELSSGDRCETACQALGSMQRSADRLCALTGEEDDRCESVRQRVERARELVYRVCSSCSAD